jgi:transposase
MRGIRVWARLLGLRRAAVEDVRMGNEGEVIVSARPGFRERDRCGVCRRRSPGYDLGEGRRRWRALDLGPAFAFVESDAPRVTRRRHGVVVCAVPWARHDSRFTRAFEDQVAWLAVNTSKTAVAELMRVPWRTVGGIIERVAAEAQRGVDLLDGAQTDRDRRDLAPQGAAIPHRRGGPSHRPAGLGRTGPGQQDGAAVLRRARRRGCKQIELVSADMAAWISGPIAERVPDAIRCVDPFHVVMLATEALGRRSPRGLERGAPAGQPRARPGAQRRPVRGPEEPREPHRPPGVQAREHSAHERQVVLRVSAQGAAAADLSAPRHCRAPAPRRLAEVGPPLPATVIREARPHDHRPPRRDPRRGRARSLQRPDPANQHPDPADRPPRVRVPQPARTDRTRDA